MTDLLDRRMLFVVGKGGVGKTTVSAALALAAARRGKRVLVAMPNVQERLSHDFDVAPIGPEVVAVAPNIDAVNMTPQSALEEYGMMVLKVRALYNAIFGSKFVKAFLHGTPGIDAWAMLGKAFFHASPPSGEPAYDLVIFDAPATGHALDMLRVPFVIHDVAPPGLLRREADRAIELFCDPERAGVVLVTIPEDMPTNETLELRDALVDELGLPIAALAINRVLDAIFTEKERPVFAELRERVGDASPLTSLAQAARVRVLREEVQQDSIDRLVGAIDAPRYDLPALFMARSSRHGVETLSRRFD
ncbi:MAG: ArsA family ATPase [Myxococcales bacterium]|nr:ArsA family ATPase [Myxococcales bacterium]